MEETDKGRNDQTGEPESPAAPEPDKTAAELDVGWGSFLDESDNPTDDDERLLRERPPHWEG